jgi:hypothetical protein
MIQQISGNRYDFTVRWDGNYFEVSTVRKKDGRKSAITNLNRIISEVLEPVLESSLIEDTYLIVDNSANGKRLFDQAIRVLGDIEWVSKYLESELDEDMQEGYDN